METYKIYIKIDDNKGSFILAKDHSSEFITKDYNEALKFFNQQRNILMEYTSVFDFSNKKLRLYLDKDNNGITRSHDNLEEEIFNLTDKLYGFLKQSGII